MANLAKVCHRFDKIQMGYQEAPLDEFARNSPFLLLRVFLDNFFASDIKSKSSTESKTEDNNDNNIY